jgi:putative FmdB family regulatory protein
MPTYDYVCGNCGHRIEVIHGVHAAGPDECPNCHTRGQMRKAIVSPTVLYKGSGWAKKDRGASASTKAAAKAASGESGGTSTESSGSESSKGSDAGGAGPDKSSDAGSSSSKSPADTGAGGSTASTTTSKGD